MKLLIIFLFIININISSAFTIQCKHQSHYEREVNEKCIKEKITKNTILKKEEYKKKLKIRFKKYVSYMLKNNLIKSDDLKNPDLAIKIPSEFQ